MQKTVTVSVAGSLLMAASISFAAAKPDGAALLKERCGTCHATARVTEVKKSKAEWKKTVARMVGKGAKLSAEEQGVLVEYLAKTYK